MVSPRRRSGRPRFLSAGDRKLFAPRGLRGKLFREVHRARFAGRDQSVRGGAWDHEGGARARADAGLRVQAGGRAEGACGDHGHRQGVVRRAGEGQAVSTFEERSKKLADAIHEVAEAHRELGLCYVMAIVDPVEQRTRSYASPGVSEEGVASVFEQVSESWKLRIARKRS